MQEAEKGNTNEDTSDIQLILNFVRSQDKKSLGSLFQKYTNLSFSVSYNILKSSSDAEDVVQAAFIQVMKKAKDTQLEKQGAFKSWLMKIVVNLSLNKLREEKGRSKLKANLIKADEGDITPTQGNNDVINEVMKAMSQLPLKYKTPIWLHHHEGFSLKELADILSIPIGTVRTHLNRGMSKLRKSLVISGATAFLIGSGLEKTIHAIETPMPTTNMTLMVDDVINGNVKSSPMTKINSKFPFVKILSALIVLSTCAFLVFSMQIKKPDDKPVVDQSNTPINSLTNIDLDFKNKKDLTFFDITAGKGKILSQSKEGTFQITQFPFNAKLKEQVVLPLKIEINWKPLKNSMHNNFLLTMTWSSYKSITLLHIPSTTQKHRVSKIENKTVLYVTEKTISRWANNKLMTIYISESDNILGVSKNRFLELICSRGLINIKNIKINTMDKSELPDISLYTKAYENFPHQNKSKRFQLPLDPTGNKKVWANYYKPTSTKRPIKK